MKVLIDGDIIVYRMAFAVQKKIYTHKETKEFFEGKKSAKEWLEDTYIEPWDDSEWEVEDQLEDWKNCKFLIDNCISDIMSKTKADSMKIYLSPKKCFRNDIAVSAEYKAGRAAPPEYKEKAYRYLREAYDAEVGDNMEADDCLGLAQTTDTCIASIDKDLYMIPGKHYDIIKQTKRLIDLKSADDWFFIQLMMGDRTDNIKGLKGVGIKTALRIMKDFEGDHVGLVRHIRNMYEENYGVFDGEDVMIETARLVYILRKGDTIEDGQWKKLLLLDD